MTRVAPGLAVVITLLMTGCAEYPVFEDRSDQVTLKHRHPSK
ncbi:MAG: hypothetical protein ACE5EU_03430 [Paracoccaceae bacterium]